MSDRIIYIDTSEIRAGQLDALKAAMEDLARFVEVNVPRIYTYRVYFNDQRTEMTVMHIHPDAESLDLHLKVAGPLFPKFASFVKLLRIDIFGEPSEYALGQLKMKAEALGGTSLEMHSLQSGFTRF